MCNLYFINLFKNGVDITVQVDNQEPVLVYLNLKEKLSNTRKRLKENSLVKMDSTLSFAEKKATSCIFAEILREDEGNMILEKIMNTEDKILYLTKISTSPTPIMEDHNVAGTVIDVNADSQEITVQMDDSQVFVRLNI